MCIRDRNAAVVTAPHPHVRCCARCSIATSSIGGRSNTCRACSPTTGASDRSPPHPAHAPGTWTATSSGTWRGSSRNPCSPVCLPGFRPDARRSDRGGGLTNASELGGLDEFCEFFPSRASNSVTRAENSATCGQLDDHPVPIGQHSIPIGQHSIPFGEQHQQLLHRRSLWHRGNRRDDHVNLPAGEDAVTDPASITITTKRSSRRAEDAGWPGASQPPAPTDPYVSLSTYTAPVTLITKLPGPRKPTSSERTCEGTFGWPLASTAWLSSWPVTVCTSYGSSAPNRHCLLYTSPSPRDGLLS